MPKDVRGGKLSDQALVVQLLQAALGAYRNPTISHKKSESVLRMEEAERAVLTRMKELREGRIPRKKPARMAVAPRKVCK